MEENTERMMIRADSAAETERIAQALENAGVQAERETVEQSTLFYVNAADEARAQQAMEQLNAQSPMPEEPEPDDARSRVKSIWLTLLILLLAALAVFGTDAIMGALRKILGWGA